MAQAFVGDDAALAKAAAKTAAIANAANASSAAGAAGDVVITGIASTASMGTEFIPGLAVHKSAAERQFEGGAAGVVSTPAS